jgi:hypothetical protein
VLQYNGLSIVNITPEQKRQEAVLSPEKSSGQVASNYNPSNE